MKSQIKNTLMMVVSMTIFGTIGLIRRYIELPSGYLAISRGIIGSLFLTTVLLVFKRKPNMSIIINRIFVLLISGFLIGANWILLFESYRYTTIANATMCYYMAPIFVIVISPILFKETMRINNVIAVIVTFIGMLLISGIFTTSQTGVGHPLGIILGLLAALLYASVIIINKKISDIPAYEKTITQLFFAGITLIPYSLLTEEINTSSINLKNIVLILTAGVVYTGIAYYLYFESMSKLKAQSVALLGYIDPVVAVLVSFFILREDFTITGLIGTLLIIAATTANEIINLRQ